MMNTTHTRQNRLTAAIGAAVIGVAAPALLFLGTGTAHAIQDISEHGGIAAIDYLPLPRDSGSCDGFNPQPDPPENPDPSTEDGVGNPNERSQILDPGSKVGIIDPGLKIGISDPQVKVGISDPEDKVGIGGPDTRPAP